MNLFCMVCRGEMPEDRARRKKAHVCSEKCKAEYRRLMGLERDRKILQALRATIQEKGAMPRIVSGRWREGGRWFTLPNSETSQP